MIPFRQFLAAALLVLGTGLGPALALSVPPAPPRFVHDGAAILGGPGREALETRLMQLNQEKGLQIGVAILRSLEDEALEDFSMRIAETWQPGFAGRDDGILITVFLEERKLRIDVGYGLEGAIPDVIAGRIIRERIAPGFRSGDYAGGLLGAVNALAAAAEGETLAPPASGGDARSSSRGVAVVAQIIFFIVFLLIARASRSRRLGKNTSALPWWLLLLYGSNRSRRHGGWGGGSSGGGSFGGGSFGGGSFGGGGASGGW